MSNELRDLLVVIGAILGIGGSITAMLYSLHKVVTKIEKVIGTDDDGKTVLDRILDRMTRVEYQLWPNGGESLADKVKANADSNAAMGESVKFIKDVMLQIVDVAPAEEVVAQPTVKVTRKKKSAPRPDSQ